MRVLFVTSEVAGVYKLGGLGDISYALPVALNKLGVIVSLVMPYYEKIKSLPVKCIGQLAADFDRRRELIFIFRALVPGTKIPLYLFRHPAFNHYKSKSMADNFAFFSKAVAEFYHYSNDILGGPYDCVHCHDWHTGLVPMLLGEQRKVKTSSLNTLASVQTKTVFTIHNHLYQGETGVMTALRLGLPKTIFHVYQTHLGRAIKFMREALEYADVITTVSPTYAKELLSGQYSDEINEVMRHRTDRMIGILNGIDQDLWNPKNDQALFANYDLGSVIGAKAQNKKYLCSALNLSQTDVPLFGFVGRLEYKQKGIDLIEKILKLELIKPENYQLVILGQGTPKIQKHLEDSVKLSSQIRFINTFDERLARRIYAGCDVILVPSKFEPCGLTQMIAMRYGALPLVRKTGGLADSVIDRQTGFVFKKYSAVDLAAKMIDAIKLFQEKPKFWREMVVRAMAEDFSWTSSAHKYLELYKNLLKKKDANRDAAAYLRVY